MCPPKARNKKRMSVFISIIWYCTGNHSQNNEARKEMKVIQNGRGKTINFFRKHSYIHMCVCVCVYMCMHICIYTHFLGHSSFSRHLAWLHISETPNDAAVETERRYLCWFHFLWLLQRRGIAWFRCHIVVLFLIVCRTPLLFSIMAAPL